MRICYECMHTCAQEFRMAVASLGNAFLASSRLNLPFQLCPFRPSFSMSFRPPPCFSLRVFNGGDASGESLPPEEKAKLALKELDNQLAELSQRTTPSPRPIADAEAQDKQMEEPSKGSLPELSDGFLVFLGAGLLLLTVVNNLLFYFFVELPDQKSKVAQQTLGKEPDSGKLSVDDSKVAPQPLVTNDL